MRITLLLALVALAGARSLHKRNAYGDELVVPSEPSPVAVENTPEEVPEPAPAPVEHVEEVQQEESGYRSKRGVQNGYGDEPVAPAAPAVEEQQPEQVEEAPEEVPEPAPAPVENVEVPQEESGYRSKRDAQNGYGDEPVAPAAPAVEEPQPEQVEEAPEEVPEPAPAPVENVEVPQEESGYRSKRDAQNGYGDEPVAPAAPAVEEQQPEQVEEAPEEVPEPAPAPVEHVEEVQQEESGYRSKRDAQNGYGDEPVAPAAPAVEEPQPEQVEEAPEEVPEPAPAPVENVEVPQEESGYRSKRDAQNGYGDEPVAPAAPAVEEPQPEQVEEAPEEVPEPAPAPVENVEVPQEESGYRSKRDAQNGYGDEPVAPAAPAVEEQQPEQVEEAPEEVPEPAPAPVENVEVPQEESGYRSKRDAQNGYGDEPVAPAAPAVEEQQPEQVEEAPEEVPEPAPAPVEHVEEVQQEESGYRSKRAAQNGYGDEPVAPAVEEQQPEPVEETPEEIPEPAPAPAEHVQEVPQEESGYRA